jgi:hypothetical protein
MAERHYLLDTNPARICVVNLCSPCRITTVSCRHSGLPGWLYEHCDGADRSEHSSVSSYTAHEQELASLNLYLQREDLNSMCASAVAAGGVCCKGGSSSS